jgi:hypothetical protein
MNPSRMPIKVHFRNVFLLFFLMFVVGTGMIFPQETEDKARRYTRSLEFDYLDWTVDTLWLKTTHGNHPLQEATDQKEQVYGYLQLVAIVQNLDNQITALYADPTIQDPSSSAMGLIAELEEKQQQMQTMAPSVEAILQEQVRSILVTEGMETRSGIFPPVQYHTTDLPLSLLISPRDRIQLDADISIQPGLNDAQKVELEKEIESNMDVSALVEEVGGIGTYPAMIMLTTDLNWLVDTIAHEWVHNYLTFYPLGFYYYASPELRTMNETTASLAGIEISAKVMEIYYPELVPAPPVPTTQAPSPAPLPPAFDYQEEMSITREQVDLLLASGEIEQAEAYMESRRQVFWDNGYLIRRINQAYFAFHGAYNDSPGGGEAGTDPVGPDVVDLRKQCGSLSVFLKTISKMDTYEDLQAALLSLPD